MTKLKLGFSVPWYFWFEKYIFLFYFYKVKLNCISHCLCEVTKIFRIRWGFAETVVLCFVIRQLIICYHSSNIKSKFFLLNGTTFANIECFVEKWILKLLRLFACGDGIIRVHILGYSLVALIYFIKLPMTWLWPVLFVRISFMVTPRKDLTCNVFRLYVCEFYACSFNGTTYSEVRSIVRFVFILRFVRFV